jgi:hypothetical protein
MKYLAAFTLTLTASSAMAGHQEEMVINSGSELRDWCRVESEAIFIGRGLMPFNWSARYWDQGNVLMTKGTWHIDGSDVTVDCSVARGAQARFASVTIQES